MYKYVYMYIYISILVIQAFWPRWGLLCPESCVVVPATLVSGLGCLQRRCGARRTQKRA